MMLPQRRLRGFGGPRHWPRGAVLLGVVALLLGLHLLSQSGGLMPVVLGAIFLAISHQRGKRAFLIPGGILLGLGLGIVLGDLLRQVAAGFAPATILGGLGAGFWFISLYGSLRTPGRTAYTWARIPGSILLGIAGVIAAITLAALTWQFTALLLGWWPVVLIVGGLWLFFTNRRRRHGW